MPANRTDMLTKAPSYGADALVFDLEDSVPLDEKRRARALAREFIGKHKAASAIYVRVNGLRTGLLQEDLEAVAVDGLAGIKLPKTESADEIRRVDAMLAKLERERGITHGSIGIGPTLESAKGVWFAYEIVSASPRIHSVMPGTAQDADLQADLGYASTDGNNAMLYYIRSRVLCAARAAGVPHVLDGVYANIRDPEGLRVSCQAARRLGYRGKQVIHPGQIETVNRIFTPTAHERAPAGNWIG